MMTSVVIDDESDHISSRSEAEVEVWGGESTGHVTHLVPVDNDVATRDDLHSYGPYNEFEAIEPWVAKRQLALRQINPLVTDVREMLWSIECARKSELR